MNDDEKVEVKDQLPTLQSVWETIVNDEKRATDEPNIAFHDKPTEMTPQQMENSMVTQIEGPNGEMLDVIVVNKAGVVVDKDAPCPEEDIEEIAEEVAKEVIDEVEDEIEEEAKPEPKPEPEPEKPKKKKVEVYKTTVEKMKPDPEALETLVMAANGKPVILDFQYDECGYCQEIAPAFEDLMKAHAGTPEDPLAFFRKVDIFEHRERLGKWGVKAMPTFKVYVLGKETDHLEGKSGFDKLEKSVKDAEAKYARFREFCGSVPDVLPDGLQVEDIFNKVDANSDNFINEEEGRIAMYCAYDKGWVTHEEQDKIFDYFASHAGEDDLDIDEMKTAFKGIHEVTDFDFGLK